MESPLTRFSRTVEGYRRYRPGYPRELVQWLSSFVAPPARVLDLGCGTGITARLFAGEGYDVVGVDPNADMLRAARLDGGGPKFVSVVRSRAEALGFVRGTFDLSISGQAFHWFDVEAAVRELARAVRPGGTSAAFWNTRVEEGLNREYEALLTQYSAEFRSVPKNQSTLALLRAALAGRSIEERTLPNQQEFDLEGFIGRVNSSSYVAHGVTDHAGFERELEKVFQRHATDGRARFDYELLALAWR